MLKTHIISFKLPKTVKEALRRRHPGRGMQSRVLLGLLKMYLNGDIPKIKYVIVTTEEI